ncbi:unnamed protein product [Parajaminaea phylloscopi]
MARSVRSDSTASDASVVRGKEPQRYRDEDDDAEAEAEARVASWDDEESVSLIQSLSAQSRGTKGQASWLLILKGILVVLSVPAIGILFFVTMWWLSSPARGSTSAVASGQTILIDGLADQRYLGSAQSHSPASLPVPKKHPSSTNDAAGNYGLLHAPDFSFSEAVRGWSTPKEADEALSLKPGSTQDLLLRNGLKSMRPVTMDAVFNGTFAVEDISLRWSAEDKDDGVFMTTDPKNLDIVFEDVTHARKERTGVGQVAPGGGKVTYVHGADVKDQDGNQLMYTGFWPSPDLSHTAFATNTKRKWRYSSHSNVWVHERESKRTVAVGGGPKASPDISNVAWIPHTSKGLVYVQNNDLFVDFDPMKQSPIRITSDGSATVFNGASDWVYEEEVLLTDHAIYISPDGSKLAWLRFDETRVPVYEFALYNPLSEPGATVPYPDSVKMKYPKPGFENPIVSAHMIDLQELKQTRVAKIIELVSPSASASSDGEVQRVDAQLATPKGQMEKIVNSVNWLDDNHLLLVETNRNADKMRTILFDTSTTRTVNVVRGKAVRHRDVGEHSWIVPSQSLTPLYAAGGKPTTAYIDIVGDEHGFKHVAYFADASTPTPTFLTSGAWEVDQLLHVDTKRGKVYFSAAKPAHYRRHVFSIDLPTSGGSITAVSSPTDLVGDAHPDRSFEADFDPKGAYYKLRETGPNVPTVKVIGVDDTSFEWVAESNNQARDVTAQYLRSHQVYYNVTIIDAQSGKPLSTTVQEIRPHDFDPNVRYPVLLNVYGGPEAQQVKHAYGRDHWHEYLANHLGYIVAVVDGRGTGFKGSEYSNGVTQQLGRLEVQDLVATASKMRDLSYVDEKRIGLWGWSYGGYFTLKALEADSGVLSLGMAVAPVTSWRFYDSVYTERYMKSPAKGENEAGYANSSVHITEGFRNAKLLLAHGTGDDNVHFESSAHMLDLLTAASVRGFWFRAFTDSTHAIRTRNAYRELHQWMTEFLMTQWGAGGKRQFKPPASLAKKSSAAAGRYSRRETGVSSEQQRLERQQRDIEDVLGLRDSLNHL